MRNRTGVPGTVKNAFTAGINYLKKEGFGKFIMRIAQWIPEYLTWKRIWIRAWLCQHVSIYERNFALYTLKKKAKVDSCVKFKRVEGGVEFCKRTGQPYEILNAGEKIEVISAEYFERQKEKKFLFDSPPIYMTVFQEADVYGATNLITVGDTALSDMTYMNRGKNRYHIAGGSVIGTQKDGRWLQAAYHATDTVVDEAIYCMGWACTNYYHFMFEILSRLMFVDGRDEYRNLPVLMDAEALAIPQMKDMFDRVNRYRHPVILIGEYERIHVKNLVFVSRNLWLPPGMRRGIDPDMEDYLISRSAVDHIRNRILDEDMRRWREPVGRKIFLSRKNCKVQRLTNTDEIEQIFAENGYQIVCPEELSFDEEVALFNNADVIVGVSGAAFTNIVFCHEGARIGVIQADSQSACDYSSIAGMAKVRFTVLGAELMVKGEQISTDTFKLNSEKCRRFIGMIEGEV